MRSTTATPTPPPHPPTQSALVTDKKDGCRFKWSYLEGQSPQLSHICNSLLGLLQWLVRLLRPRVIRSRCSPCSPKGEFYSKIIKKNPPKIYLCPFTYSTGMMCTVVKHLTRDVISEILSATVLSERHIRRLELVCSSDSLFSLVCLMDVNVINALVSIKKTSPGSVRARAFSRITRASWQPAADQMMRGTSSGSFSHFWFQVCV